MSVINKMLRDLDQRKSEPAAERKHTVSVAMVASSPRAQRNPTVPRVAIAALFVLALVAAAWWGWLQMQEVDSPPRPTAAAIPSAMPAVVTAAASSPAAVVVAAPVASAPLAVQPPAQLAASTPKAAVASSAPIPAVAAASQPTYVSTPLKIDTALTLPKPAKAPAPEPAVTAASSVPTIPPAQRQLQAGREAQVQAQSLWNAGAKEAAMDLLQQAVDNVERGMAAEPAAAQLQLLASLARDLTRMQLADGRAGAAWDLLVRMEPWIRNEADLWAVRGNAAQRLGRHQESAHAYLAALQIRPNEQRWLLGAAVSLAASGQTAAAAEMADKARSVGSISPEVLAYLRQAGVPLKDK